MKRPKLGASKVDRDITERKSAERALRESAGRMRALIETAVDGAILIDARGVVLMVNPACEKLFGYFADEVIGKNVKMNISTTPRASIRRSQEHTSELQSRQYLLCRL